VLALFAAAHVGGAFMMRGAAATPSAPAELTHQGDLSGRYLYNRCKSQQLAGLSPPSTAGRGPLRPALPTAANRRILAHGRQVVRDDCVCSRAERVRPPRRKNDKVFLGGTRCEQDSRWV